MSRTTFPARLADLEFSLELPTGFITPPLPEDETDFDDPTKTAPLTLIASPVAAVLLAISARPAYEDGSVIQWLTYLAAHHEITLTKLMPGKLGPHPAVLAEGKQVQDGTALNMLFAAVEDGGRLIVLNALCPTELWASYEQPLRRAIETFELARPRGQTTPLVPGVPTGPALGAAEGVSP